MTLWTDAHNHLQDPRLGAILPELVPTMRAAGVESCVVNATREEDWDAVSTLAAAHPQWIRPAYGIHPWRARHVSSGWQQRLARLLESQPHASIGECGLDQWVADPPAHLQTPVFLAQLQLARDLDRPVTIHCLKAWGLLFDAFNACPPPPRFLMHSFGGSIETARRLLPLGAFFSFSGHFLHARKHAVREVFRQLPLDRILVETDAPDMTPPAPLITHPLASQLNHPANLPAIGGALAGLLGMPADDLAAITRANARRCFAT